MSWQPSQEPPAIARPSLSALPQLVGGGAAGVALFLVLNGISAQWLDHAARGQDAAWFLVLGAALTGVAVYLAVRYPTPGLAAGITMAILVLIGLLIGYSRDFGLGGSLGGWDPVSILRHGAYQPLLPTFAAGLVGAALGGRIHQADG